MLKARCDDEVAAEGEGSFGDGFWQFPVGNGDYVRPSGTEEA